MLKSQSRALKQCFSTPGLQPKSGSPYDFCGSLQYYYSFAQELQEVLLILSTLLHNLVTDQGAL